MRPRLPESFLSLYIILFCKVQDEKTEIYQKFIKELIIIS